VKFRKLEEGDVDAVLAVESLSPEAARWSRGDYERAARGGFAGWVAENDFRVSGFLIARQIAVEMEILNLAVAPAARRSGIGSQLLDESLRWGKSSGAERVYLEVRASNHAAQRFYERHGFAVTGRRPRYYSEPGEDGLVLSRALT